MLKESAIASACIILIVVGFCLVFCPVFGWDYDVIPKVAVVAGAIPFLRAAILQMWLQSHIVTAKAERWYLNLPPHLRRVELKPPAEKPDPLPELPEPNRVRLVTVQSTNPTTIMAHEVKNHNGETLRFVAVPSQTLIDDAPERDLVEFINGLSFRGHSIRSWYGLKMPSGREVDNRYHDTLIRPLIKCGAVVGRRRRSAGRLVMKPEEIKTRLGLCSSAPTAPTI